jgi:2-keto-3-deoxy-galactonokinase
MDDNMTTGLTSTSEDRTTISPRSRAGLAERLARAEERRQRAERDLAQLRARARAIERTRDNRARFLLGALLLTEAAGNPRLLAWIHSRLGQLSGREREAVEAALRCLNEPT